MFEVLDDDELLRRVFNREDYLEWHADEGRWVPSLAGLQFDPDGMSVFDERVLKENGDSSADVATLGGTKTDELAYAAAAGTLRELGMPVDASPNDVTPIGYAHASVLKPEGLTKADFRELRTDAATIMQCVHGVPRPQPPPQ